MPVSATLTAISTNASPGVTRLVTVTPPEDVNLMALASRLIRICRNRPLSPMTSAGKGVSWQISRKSPFSRACGFRMPAASRMQSASENGSATIGSLSASSFE